ncbi:hypothetical protein P3X46_010753 [Hevea brasiliensis]|uniref:Trafficking protein particle complex subunit 2 n=1 Tax=Hevea brasiliensis TaxID=3981 RepID=A0ABQ9MF09_HEVBR|nr:hypothetical protein P3X46_010753 [Hevea brasiliensis]
MATTACFIIVSRNDIPIYEAEVGSATKREDAAQLHQFVLHAALDIVQDLAWTTSAMFLKAIDNFNDLAVSVYVTAGNILFFFVISLIKQITQIKLDVLNFFFVDKNVIYHDTSKRIYWIISINITCKVHLWTLDA